MMIIMIVVVVLIMIIIIMIIIIIVFNTVESHNLTRFITKVKISTFIAYC